MTRINNKNKNDNKSVCLYVNDITNDIANFLL